MARNADTETGPEPRPRPRPTPQAPPRPTPQAPPQPAPQPLPTPGPVPQPKPAPPKIISPDRARLRNLAVNAYAANGGLSGLLGVPRAPISYGAGEARWNLTGGHVISRADGTTSVSFDQRVKIEWIGYKCWAESKHDQSSNSDEPYFIISAVMAGYSFTSRFGPYSDVNSGESEVQEFPLTEHFPVAPGYLHVVAMEHDEGRTQEARRKVENTMKEAAAAASQAVTAYNLLAAAGGGAGVDPMVDVAIAVAVPLFAPAAKLITAVAGLGDDSVAASSTSLFHERDGYAQPPDKGTHGGKKWTHKVYLDGGSAGKYDVFFRVTIVNVRRPEAAAS